MKQTSLMLFQTLQVNIPANKIGFVQEKRVQAAESLAQVFNSGSISL